MPGGGAVGSILIALRADVDSLKADLDKAKATIAEFERKTKDTADSAERSGRKIELSHEVIKRSTAQVVTGVLLMSDSFKGAGEAGQLAGHALGAFMAGGPVAAGVSLVTGLFKMFAESEREAAEATKKRAEEIAKLRAQEKKDLDELIEKNQLLADKQRDVEEHLPSGTTTERRQSASDEAATLDKIAMAKLRLADAERALGAANAQIARDRRGIEGRAYPASVAAAVAAQVELSAAKQALADLERRLEEIHKASTRTEAGAEESVLKALADDAVRAAGEMERAEDALLKLKRESAASGANALRLAGEMGVVPWTAPGKGSFAKPWDTDAAAAEATYQASQKLLEIRRQMSGMSAREASGLHEIADLEHAIAVEEAKGAAANQEKLVALAIQLANAKELLPLILQMAKSAEDAAKAERVKAALLSIDDEIKGLYAVTEEQQKQLAIEREIARLREAGVKEAAIQARIAALSQAQLWRSMYDAAAAARSRAEQEWTGFVSGIEQTLAGGITGAIVDGVTNGGKRFEEIWKNIVNSLLQQTIHSLVSSGLNALFGSIGGGLFGGGGGGGLGAVLSGGCEGGT